MIEVNARRQGLGRRQTLSLLKVGLLMAATTTSIVATSAESANATAYSVMAIGANGRIAPSFSSGATGYYGKGTDVIMICWLDAERLTPPAARYSSPRWFVVKTAVGSWKAWMHSSWVDRQTTVRRCNSTNLLSA